MRTEHDVDTSKELPTVISFCSGYGGIERGLDLAGLEHRVIAYVEIEAYAVANLVAKMETGQLVPAPIFTDLKTFPAHLFRGAVDIIVGGYPCQPFSAAGRRLGESDPRHLFPYILDHIHAIRPVRCFFENVEGHISLGLREVVGELESAGYRTTWGIFSAAEVGAPHQRNRVYIMADAIGGVSFRWADQSRRQTKERVAVDRAGEGRGKGDAADILGANTDHRTGGAQQERKHEGAEEPDGCGSGGLAASDTQGLADTDSTRQQSTQRQPGSPEARNDIGGRGTELADPNSQRLQSATDELRQERSEGNAIERTRAASESEAGRTGATESVDPNSAGLKQSDQETEGQSSEQPDSGCVQSGGSADTDSAGLERRLQDGVADPQGREEPGDGLTAECGDWGGGYRSGTWPSESGLDRVVDGCANRVDRIRLLGNGVVPATAAKAWEVLSSRMEAL